MTDLKPKQNPQCSFQHQASCLVLAWKISGRSQEVSHVHVCMLSHFSSVWLCDPVNCSSPSFPADGILQARIPEWIARPFSCGSSRQRDWTCSISYLLLHWQAGSLPLVPRAKSKFHRKVYKYSQTGRDW